MATRLYMHHPTVGSQILPDTHRGDNSAGLRGGTTGWQARGMTTAAPSGVGGSTGTTSVAGTTPGLNTGESSNNGLEWISLPLAADATISGTVTFNGYGLESSMNANAGLQVVVDRIAGADLAITEVVDSESGSELGTSVSVRNWTASPTSTGFLRGDRIRVRWLFNDAGGTMASGHTLTLQYDGTSGNNADTWVEFTENLTFESSDPSGSTLYLTDTASAINPGAAVEKEAWTSRGSGSVNAVTSTAAGWTAGIQITNTAGGTAIEWYTRELQAFTLGGKAKLNVRCLESNSAADASLRAEVAVCESDGTSPAVWATALVAPDAASPNGEVPTADAAKFIYLAGDDTPVTDGKRLRIRLYLDDTALNPLANGFTATVSYSGTSAAAAGDTYLTLPQSVSEFSSAPVPRHGFVNFQDPGLF